MKKNVVKTMSVGLSLAMAASPMTAFAYITFPAAGRIIC